MERMALALEFKQRVRMAPDPPVRRVRERRSPVLLLGLCGWLGAVTFGFGVDQGYLPIGRWVDGLERDSDDRAPAPTPQALEPLRPVAAPRPPSPSMVAAPIAPAQRPELPVSPTDPEPSPVARSAAAPQRVAVANPEPEDEPSGDDPSRPPSAVQTPEFDQPLPPATRSWAEATRATSCEAAAAAYTEEINPNGGRSPPDITQAEYAAILEHGRWFEHCGVPAACRLQVCVAVQQGRAVGVTVHTTPWRADIERCVAAAARGLTFPSHPRLDVTRTTFAPQ
jgi:hypothetical protein